MSSNILYRKFDLPHSRTNTWCLYVPGWAMDGHIFDYISRNSNAIIIDRYDPFLFKKDIESLLKTLNISKARFVGYSMGAMAGTFLDNSSIQEWTWISPALHYPKPVIDFIKKQILSNKNSYLKQFYSACFSNEKYLKSFLQKHGERLIETLDTDYLINGLDFLQKTSLLENSYAKTPTHNIFFGDEDKIVPEPDQLKLISFFKGTVDVLPKSGHYCLAI